MHLTTTDVCEMLREVGWCRFPAMSDAVYRELVASIGKPWCETVVELRPNVQTYLCRTESVPFHMDHPDADFMAWRCEKQDDSDGSQQLIDGFAALEACSAETRNALRKVHAEVRVRKDEPPSRVPLVRSTPLGERLFYASWIRPVETDAVAVEAFNELKAAIERRETTELQEVRLTEGEVLVIDNGRMLHGRRAVAPNSSRRLRRFWITAP